MKIVLWECFTEGFEDDDFDDYDDDGLVRESSVDGWMASLTQ